MLVSLVQSASCSAKALRPYLDVATLQVYSCEAQNCLQAAEAELKAALELGAGGSLDELQGALLTAGLAAKLERRPFESELWQALQRVAGEPEVPSSRSLQGSCSPWRCCRAFRAHHKNCSGSVTEQAACMHMRY